MDAGGVQEYVELLEATDRRGAIELIGALAASGVSVEELVQDLLVPAQREVGLRWERRQWNVAQEHAATSITDAALAMLTVEQQGSGEAGHVLVGCVEGEWHSMPARMVAEMFRLRGWEVTFLGPSLPAGDLGAHIAWAGPDAVGLSCSVPLFLKGAQRGIDACRQAGVPVLAGGAGFGRDGEYAMTLGASNWAPDPQSGTDVLTQWLQERPLARATPPAGDQDHLLLEAARSDVVEGALEQLLNRKQKSNAAELREALDLLAWAVENATLVAQPDVVIACAPMIERAMSEQLAEVTPVGSLVEAMLPELRRRSTRAAALVERTLPAVSRRLGPSDS